MSMTRVLAIAAVVVAGGAAAGASVAVWQSTPGVQSPAAATAAVLPAGPGRLRPIPHPPVARLVVLRYPTLTVGDSGTRVLRLQQLLADTAYLPLRFHRTGRPRISPLAARAGSFSWRFAPPAGLAAQWQRGTFGEVTRGAVMTFEAEHGLTPDGIAGPRVWRALVAAAAHGRWTHRPYVYAYVSETLPESITIYADGRRVLHTAANTGIPQAPTAQGTWPVYLRYTTTTMQGTNPDGSHYYDTGIPWVSYFNGGDAVHGFLRPSYGSPQSLGCVELPYAEAHTAFELMTYGTLVTVGA